MDMIFAEYQSGFMLGLIMRRVLYKKTLVVKSIG